MYMMNLPISYRNAKSIERKTPADRKIRVTPKFAVTLQCCYMYCIWVIPCHFINLFVLTLSEIDETYMYNTCST